MGLSKWLSNIWVNCQLVKKSEAELVIQKIEFVEKTNREKGLMPLTEAAVLEKYPHLKKIKACFV